MRGVSFGLGVVAASLAAGPLVAVPPILIAAFSRPFEMGSTLGGAIFILVLGVPIGFVVALPVNLSAAALLAALGRQNIATRLPVVWLISGAMLGGAILLPFGGELTNPGIFVSALLGATEAGICRWFTKWDD